MIGLIKHFGCKEKNKQDEQDNACERKTPADNAPCSEEKTVESTVIFAEKESD